jgi:hypothetical protein
MPAEADIVLDTPTRRLLLVECTWMKEPSLTKAAQLRDSLSPLWSIAAEYFMLALRTELHLWRKDAPAGSQPQFTASAIQIWRDYLGSLAGQLETLRSESMEIAVAAWLNDLANNVTRLDPASESDHLLLESGLYDQMKGGVVRRHVPS